MSSASCSSQTHRWSRLNSSRIDSRIGSLNAPKVPALDSRDVASRSVEVTISASVGGSSSGRVEGHFFGGYVTPLVTSTAVESSAPSAQGTGVDPLPQEVIRSALRPGSSTRNDGTGWSIRCSFGGGCVGAVRRSSGAGRSCQQAGRCRVGGRLGRREIGAFRKRRGSSLDRADLFASGSGPPASGGRG